MKKTITRSPRSTRTVKKERIVEEAPVSDPSSQNNSLTSPQNMKSTIMVALLILVAFFAGYLWNKTQMLQAQIKTQGTQQTPQAQTQQNPAITLDKVKPVFADGYVHFGDANRKNLVIEVSDPSCPFCHVADGLDREVALTLNRGALKYVADGGTYVAPVPEIRKMVDAGKASYAFVYANGHGSGKLAAEALYCAFDNNKFWEAHEIVMSNKGYTVLNSQDLDRDSSGAPTDTDKNMQFIADLFGPAVDSATIKDCLSSKKYESKVTRDEQLSRSFPGFQGTPYFSVNTTSFPGAYSFPDMKSAFVN